jgi:hypothetical protein
MTDMKNKSLLNLENKLESLVEGAFNQMFRRRLTTQDIVLALVRALESALLVQDRQTPPIAPDTYHLALHPKTLTHLAEQQDVFITSLQDYIVSLATEHQYQLQHHPDILLLADQDLAQHQIHVTAKHRTQAQQATSAMQPVAEKQIQHTHCQLIVDGTRHIDLDKNTITVGRSPQNDIIIDDTHISRHHLQLRWREGVYLLFDVQGKGNTRVNETVVREHRLQSGDVIQIGQTKLFYFVDEQNQRSSPSTTSAMDSVDL